MIAHVTLTVALATRRLADPRVRTIVSTSTSSDCLQCSSCCCGVSWVTAVPSCAPNYACLLRLRFGDAPAAMACSSVQVHRCMRYTCARAREHRHSTVGDSCRTWCTAHGATQTGAQVLSSMSPHVAVRTDVQHTTSQATWQATPRAACECTQRITPAPVTHSRLYTTTCVCVYAPRPGPAARGLAE